MTLTLLWPEIRANWSYNPANFKWCGLLVGFWCWTIHVTWSRNCTQKNGALDLGLLTVLAWLALRFSSAEHNNNENQDEHNQLKWVQCMQLSVGFTLRYNYITSIYNDRGYTNYLPWFKSDKLLASDSEGVSNETVVMLTCNLTYLSDIFFNSGIYNADNRVTVCIWILQR